MPAWKGGDQGASWPLCAEAAEAGAGTHVTLPWGFRSIFPGPGEGHFPTLGQTPEPRRLNTEGKYPQQAAPGLLYLSPR